MDDIEVTELPEILTARQREIIESNLRAFGRHLRVSVLAGFDGNDWSSQDGRIFLWVNVDYNSYHHKQYFTDLGFYLDAHQLCSVISRYIMWRQGDDNQS
jgi:hypothetical protein